MVANVNVEVKIFEVTSLFVCLMKAMNMLDDDGLHFNKISTQTFVILVVSVCFLCTDKGRAINF